jgi:hypothetical protein
MIDVKQEMFKSQSKKKQEYSFKPSAISIHPSTSEIYITDGPKGRLLILNDSGIKQLYQFDQKDFPQPEGITFNPQGEMFISNEGKKSPGTILKVEIN